MRALLDEIDPGRTAVRSFAVHAASLDDVFLALTGPTHADPRQPETSEPAASPAPRGDRPCLDATGPAWS